MRILHTSHSYAPAIDGLAEVVGQISTRLAKKGYDPVYGARPLARVIQVEVRDRLTDEILFGQLEHGGTVTLGLEEDRLTFAFDEMTGRDAELTDSGR